MIINIYIYIYVLLLELGVTPFRYSGIITWHKAAIKAKYRTMTFYIGGWWVCGWVGGGWGIYGEEGEIGAAG